MKLKLALLALAAGLAATSARAGFAASCSASQGASIRQRRAQRG